MPILALELNAIDETDELLTDFEARNREVCRLAKSKSGSGMDILTLLVDHSLEISGSIALLIVALKARKIKFKVTVDGVEVDAESL